VTLTDPSSTLVDPDPAGTMTDSTSTTDPTSDPRTRAKLLDLSLTQLVGGSLAAATAAALGSRLGLVGTIAGASVGSVITAVAANLYTNSMSRARDAVVLARAVSRGTSTTPGGPWWRAPQGPTVRRTAFTAAAVFALAGAVVTGLQLTTGVPVTGTHLGPRSAAPVVEAPAQDGTGSRGGDTSGGAATGTPAPTTPGAAPSTTTQAQGSTGTQTAPPTSDPTPPPTPGTTTPPAEPTPQDTTPAP
jgi:hypothetical protein